MTSVFRNEKDIQKLEQVARHKEESKCMKAFDFDGDLENTMKFFESVKKEEHSSWKIEDI